MALVNFLLLAVFAIALTFSATPAHAISLHSHHNARQILNTHDVLVNKKRSVGRRCNAGHPPAKPTTTTTTTTTTSHHVVANTQPAASTNTGGGGNSGGKVGLAWTNGPTGLSTVVTGNVHHIYTWSPFIPSNAKKLGLVTMAMLWGDRDVYDFKRLVVRGYADIAMGPNEPNEPGQSNMSPGHAAYLWQTYIQPLKAEGYQLISPATSSNPNGLIWMKEFMAACHGCTFDGISLHWYDTTATKFIDYCTLWHNTFHTPIWVTEFACQNFNGGPQCSMGEIYSFMSTVTHWMESTSWIASYFAFGMFTGGMDGVNPDNQLLQPNGQPTALGWEYLKS